MNDGDALFAKSKAFRRTVSDLQSALTQLLPQGQDVIRNNNENAFRAMGYTISIVSLRALAVECLLKAVAFKKMGKHRKDAQGHDLLQLYEDLDSDTKKIAVRLGDIHGIAPLEKTLGKHRSDFLGWRYPNDRKWGIHADFLDLAKALDVLIVLHVHKFFTYTRISSDRPPPGDPV